MRIRGSSVRLALISMLVLISGMQTGPAFARTELTPTLELNQTFIDVDQTVGSGTSGSVTVISPGLDYSIETPKTELDMSLAVNAEIYSGLDRDDENIPVLDLGAVFDHDPGRWQSTLSAGIQQVNASDDGIQSISDEVFNPFTEELRTATAGTDYNDRLSGNMDYSAGLGLDYTEYEDEPSTKGANLNLSIDNFRSGNAFTWVGSMFNEITETEGEDTQVDLLALTLNYRVNQRWQAFIDFSNWDTDEDDLSMDGYLVGLSWTSNQRTFVRAGIGELDGEATYNLVAQVTRRRLLLNAKYSEGITSARTDTLTQMGGGFTGALDSGSVSAELVLQKRGDLGFSLQGRRSLFSFNLYDYTRDPIVTSDVEDGTGFEMNFTRQLPRSATLGVGVYGQETELTETNELAEINTYYSKTVAKSVEARVNLNLAKQDSSLDENEYEQVQLGFIVFMTF